MANFVFDVALGKAAIWAADVNLVGGSFVIVPLEATGIETDAVLRDKATLTAVLAGATNEQTTMGRKFVSGGTAMVITDSTTDDKTYVGFNTPTTQTWTSASGNDVAAFVIGYLADGLSGDSNIKPVVKLDLGFTPVGTVVVDFGSYFLDAASAT